MSKIPLFDGHCDTALELSLKKLPVGSLAQNELHVDLKKAGAYSKYAQFFAIFGVPQMYPDGDVFTIIYERLIKELEFLSDKIALTRTKAEAEDAFKTGKTAAFLSVEGAELLGCDPKRLEDAYLKGVRSLCLTWNRATELTGTHTEDRDRGLSLKGKDYVRLAQDLGIIIDVSHISDPGFWDIIKISRAPVIATHSNSRAVCEHSRNLTDDMFKAIRDSGGTAGINLYADFLGSGEVSIETVLRHIDRFLNMDGEKSLAIGGDLDGCDRLPAGINNLGDVGLIYEELSKRGYPEQLLEDIFFNNLMRVVETVCTM
jgi:membrane dipeptidase